MSYDIHMCVDVGSPNGHTRVGDSFNMTSNVACMWHHAFTAVGAGFTLRDLGHCEPKMTGAEVAPWIRKAKAHMQANPDVYLPMQPSNGWGSYAGAMRYLSDIATAAEEYPRALLYVSN